MAVASRTRSPAPLSGQAFYDYVTRRAVAYGLDPNAVLAVASQEGLGGGVGDGGTSFGPWQLHVGGALPPAVWSHGPAYAQAWAWSPAGIDYALRQMAAKGASQESGPSAIETIVSRFERPSNPTAEIIGAEGQYSRSPASFSRTRPDIPGGSAPGGGGGIGGVVSSIGDAVVSPFEGIWRDSVGVISGPADFLRMALWLVEPKTWLRAVEFVAGAGLILLALRGLFLILVERETGMAFSTVEGAAGLLEKRARPKVDTLVPGGQRRHQRRQARAAASEKASRSAKLDEAFGAEIPF